MANNLPFGDAFLIKTPALDKLSDRVYAEQIDREHYQRQQNKLLDDEFARNMSGIRDADIPDLTKAYGDYKLSYQQLQKDKNATPDKQLDVLRKKASVYDVINKSKEDKTWEDAQAKQIMTDRKGYYADNAHDLLISRRNTPVSKIDRSKDADLLYKYSLPDLDKELKFAEGTPRDVQIVLGQSKTDPLKDDKEVYKVGNSPKQFYNTLLQGLVANNKGRNFSGIVNNKYSDAEIDDLQNKYTAKINDPKFIAIYGKPEPFTDGTRGMTELEKAVAIETMEKVVNTPFAPTKLVSELNADRAMKNRQQFAVEQQARGHKNSLERLRLAGNLRLYNSKALIDYRDDAIATGNEDWFNTYIDKLGEEARTQTPILISGAPDKEHIISLTGQDKDALKNDGQTPDMVTITSDGKYRLIYYKYGKKGRTDEVDKSRTELITKDQFKKDLGYKPLSKKELGKVMSSGNKTYNYNGKTYTEAQLESAAKQSGRTIEEYKKELGIK